MIGSPEDMERGVLALLIAVLDGTCETDTHALLCDEDPHYAVKVAHRLAHMFVESIDEEDHEEMRADLIAQLRDDTPET